MWPVVFLASKDPISSAFDEFAPWRGRQSADPIDVQHSLVIRDGPGTPCPLHLI